MFLFYRVVPAFSAPAIGPIIANFAVNKKGWRWSMWELLWIAGFVIFLLIFIMPETSHATILLRRAKRLRKLTGNQNLKSESEIMQAHKSAKDTILEALIRPFQITILDPSIAFTNVYTGILYGVYCKPFISSEKYISFVWIKLYLFLYSYRSLF